MAIQKLDDANFNDFISKGECLVDFYADWCGPCKMLGPIFEKASNEVKNVKFGKINVDGNQDTASKFGVMSIPTVIFFKDGKQVERVTGVMGVEDIKKKIKDSF